MVRTAPLRRAAAALAAAGLTATAAPAPAQTGFDLESFRPMPNRQDDALGLASTRALAPLQLSVGAFVGYARNLLVELDASGTRQRSVVSDHLPTHVLAALGIADWFELGVDVPIVVYRDGEALDGLSTAAPEHGAGLGDVRVIPKLRVLDPAEGFGLAVVVDTRLPTGDRARLMGGGFGVEPKLAAELPVGSARLLANAGYRLRDRVVFGDLVVGDALTFGIAGDLPVAGVHVIPEVAGEVPLAAADDGLQASAGLEGRLGVRAALGDGLSLDVGGGVGLLSAAGTPDFRTFLGLQWTSAAAEVAEPEPEPEPPPHPVDGDGDGIPDEADRCPTEPEDMDGFEDEDGCPDLDDDQDGIPDAQDRCPREPEDMDGFEDEDGCPDLDNDQDGILDHLDKCPNEAETLNGEDDDDGCPDVTTEQAFEVTCVGVDLETIHFGYADAKLTPGSLPVLDRMARILTSATYITKVRIEGHTDARGSKEFNLELSRRRSEAVRDYLVQEGVAPERLEAAAMGEQAAIADNTTAEGRRKNRRVAFIITAQDRCK